MADPATLKVVMGIMNAATALGGMDSKDASFLQKLLIGFFIVLTILCAVVYVLLAPATLFFGNSNVLSFRDKYQSSVVTYYTTNQIGIYPLPGTTDYITSNYGTRDNPLSGIGSEVHTGIDFGTAHHSPLVAIAEGTVERVGIDKSFGKHVLIKHKASTGTFYTFYAHMSQIYVIRGQEVTTFQIIGKEGGQPNQDPSPGRSTGHHLHFEIRNGPYGWSHTDPYPYILEPPEEEEEEEITSTPTK